jgi:hypothetical protein
MLALVKTLAAFFVGIVIASPPTPVSTSDENSNYERDRMSKIEVNTAVR